MSTLDEQCRRQRAVIQQRRHPPEVAASYLRVMRLLNKRSQRAKRLADAVANEDSPQRRAWMVWRAITLHVAAFYQGRPYDPRGAAYVLDTHVPYAEQYAVLLGAVLAAQKLRAKVALDSAHDMATMAPHERHCETLTLVLQALERAHQGWVCEDDLAGKKRLKLRQWAHKAETMHPELLDAQNPKVK